MPGSLVIDGGLQPGQVVQRRRSGAVLRLTGRSHRDGPLLARIADGRGAIAGWRMRPVGRIRQGRFAITLRGIPAGGPYRLDLHAGDGKTAIAGWYVGDVWVLAGQSNMEGIGDLRHRPPTHPLVRCLRMDGRWTKADEPIIHLPESRHPVHEPCAIDRAEALRQRQLRRKGVGPGVWFARAMLRSTGVPQGLIGCAHGGTTLDQWDPARRRLGVHSLYGSLLASMRATAQPVAGLLWYQGESDANAAHHAAYGRRTAALLASLRRDLAQPRLPVALVQLGRWAHGDAASGPWWESVREQQRRVAAAVPRVGLAAAGDLPLDDPIHIGGDGQRSLGQRLARIMARLAHGSRERPEPGPLACRRILPRGPASRTEVIEITIADAVGGLVCSGIPDIRLMTADGAPLPPPFRCEVVDDRLRLWCVGLPGHQPIQLIHGAGCDPRLAVHDRRHAALCAFGPLSVDPPRGLGPWLTRWRMAGPFTDADAAARPARRRFRPIAAGSHGLLTVRDAFGGSGSLWLEHELDPLPGPCSVLLGTDGPFRAFLGDQDLGGSVNGFNAALDSLVELPMPRRGSRTLRILLNLNQGLTWGLCARVVSRRSNRAARDR